MHSGLSGRLPSPPSDESPDAIPRGSPIGAWLFGLITFGAVLTFVLRLGEIQEMARLARAIRPLDIALAAGLQTLTYFCAAAVWRVALRHGGALVPWRVLIPLALAMLFTNQALPSAGLSGSALVVRSLARRGVPKPLALAALLTGLVTNWAAYSVGLAASLVTLSVHHEMGVSALLVSALFGLMTVAVTAVILSIENIARSTWYRRLTRAPFIGGLVRDLAATPTILLRDRTLLVRTVALQLVQLGFDAATLWVLLAGLGRPTAFPLVFVSYVMASTAANIAPIPMGLGTFEATCVAMLHLSGVSIEAALMATLLLRGFTVWLPMLPGLWFARRAVRT